MTIAPIYQRTECPVCLTDPFIENPTLQSTTWYGHSVINHPNLPSETRIIHGICQNCLPTVPINEQSQSCFICQQPFPSGRRNVISITREGALLSEALEPLTLNILLQYLKKNRLAALHLLGLTGLSLMGASIFIKPSQKAALIALFGALFIGAWAITSLSIISNRNAPIQPDNVLNENPPL